MTLPLYLNTFVFQNIKERTLASACTERSEGMQAARARELVAGIACSEVRAADPGLSV